MPDKASLPYWRFKDRTNNQIYDINAVKLYRTILFALSGDVGGSVSTDLSGNVDLSTVIANGAVTESKIATDAVTTDKIKDLNVTFEKLATTVYGGSIAEGSADKLATKVQVKQYVENVIAGQGTYRGSQTVATINSWTMANLNNGDRVNVKDSGTVTIDGHSLPVRAGEDLTLWKYVDAGVTHAIWQSHDGEFKLLQQVVDEQGGVGMTLTRLQQNANGDIVATFAQIAVTSAQVTDKMSTYDGTGDNKTKLVTGEAVKAAIDTLNAMITSSDGTNVQVKVTEADGKITAVNVVTDNTENRNNKVSTWSQTPTDTHYPSEKLVKQSLDSKADKVASATAGNFAGLDGNGNITDSGKKASDFATAAQGGKADSAIQGVKVNGTELTPDANKKVDIPLAANSSGTGTDGAMSGADKVKLDGISSGATKVESSQTNGNIKVDRTETTVYTHPTSGANTSKGDTTAQTPGFGGTFKALSATVDAQGHTTALAEHTVTIPSTTATASSGGTGGNAGLMSAEDKEKLDDVSAGATKVEASQTNGNVKINGTETNVYSHPESGANTSKGDTTPQTPGFGGTFKALSATVDSMGHTTALAEHTVTIPDTTAAPSTDGVGGSTGLMSAADKEKLDNISSGKTTKEKDEVVAAALDDLDARMHAVEETVSAENLGTRTADDFNAQVLKVGGDDVRDLLAGKVDKVDGKGLSTNDFTDALKNKLDGIEAGAEANVQSDWNQTNTAADDFIKNKPQNLVQDANYVHTDNNFTDAYKGAVDANSAARHAHSNKTLLDNISQSDIDNWNSKQAALSFMTDAEVDALFTAAWNAANA